MSSPSSSGSSPTAQSEGLKGKSRGRKGKGRSKRDSLPYVAELNPELLKPSCTENFARAFTNNTEYHHELTSSTEAVLHQDPFTCCILPKFIKEEHFLEGLRDELLDQIFCEKNNDLYQFQQQLEWSRIVGLQTDDLKKISAPHARAIRKLLSESFLDWLRQVTGIPLTDKIDATCSRYDRTDVLLCHDDELDSRRIAFILYLVPPWKEHDGGSLDLFSMDGYGQPQSVSRSILPVWNTLAWFEVTEASHHQVAEVLTADKTRLSVNGWFHGPVIPRPERYIERPTPLQRYVEVEESVFSEWINPIYLDPEVQGQIQERFETDSEIELQGFLKEEKYHALVSALVGEKMKWVQKGPANKRHYLQAEAENVPDIVGECIKFLKSEAMFLTLSNLTGLTLHPLAAEADSDDDDSRTVSPCTSGSVECEDARSGSESEVSTSEKNKPWKKRRKLNSDSSDGKADGKSGEGRGNPRCRCEVRKWTRGCYTLMHDTDAEGSEFALDSMLYCFCKGWQPDYGGFTSYIAKDEDEELLTVNPAENSLALVYRDKETLRFVKHINCGIKEMQNGGCFYDFCTVYYE